MSVTSFSIVSCECCRAVSVERVMSVTSCFGLAVLEQVMSVTSCFALAVLEQVMSVTSCSVASLGCH